MEGGGDGGCEGGGGCCVSCFSGGKGVVEV